MMNILATCSSEKAAMAFQVRITWEWSFILQIHELRTWLEAYTCHFIDPWAAVATWLHTHTHTHTHTHKPKHTTLCLACACAPRHNYVHIQHIHNYMYKTTCKASVDTLKVLFIIWTSTTDTLKIKVSSLRYWHCDCLARFVCEIKLRMPRLSLLSESKTLLLYSSAGILKICWYNGSNSLADSEAWWSKRPGQVVIIFTCHEARVHRDVCTLATAITMRADSFCHHVIICFTSWMSYFASLTHDFVPHGSCIVHRIRRDRIQD